MTHTQTDARAQTGTQADTPGSYTQASSDGTAEARTAQLVPIRVRTLAIAMASDAGNGSSQQR